MAKASEGRLRSIGMDLIDEPKGVIRLEIDSEEVQSLARNIEKVGLLQPILIRPNGKRFEIVAGHRRYLAHEVLGRKEIRCYVREISDLDCSLARASENIRRVDLSPIEEAAIYADLRDTHELSYDQIGERMGKSAGIVKRRLDLLKMPAQLQQAVHKKQIGYAVAEELWRLKDITKLDYYLGYAVDHGATLVIVREWVRDALAQERRAASVNGGRGGEYSPFESRPVYISCDLCKGPLNIEDVLHLKACPGCFEAIKKALSNIQEQKEG